MNVSFNLQKTPHTWPWRASYGVPLVMILDNIDCVITAPHSASKIDFIVVQWHPNITDQFEGDIWTFPSKDSITRYTDIYKAAKRNAEIYLYVDYQRLRAEMLMI